MAREHTLKIQLSDDELEQLDELRGGIPRAVYVRSLIHRPPEVKDVAARQEALGILTAMARDGKVTPAVELAKLLKGDDAAAGGGPTDPLAEVDQIFRTKANDGGIAT